MTNIEPIDPFKPIGEAATRVVTRLEKGRVIEWDGKPIDKPGRYAGIPIDAYHGACTAGPGISSSGLRTIATACIAPLRSNRRTILDKELQRLVTEQMRIETRYARRKSA